VAEQSDHSFRQGELSEKRKGHRAGKEGEKPTRAGKIKTGSSIDCKDMAKRGRDDWVGESSKKGARENEQTQEEIRAVMLQILKRPAQKRRKSNTPIRWTFHAMLKIKLLVPKEETKQKEED